MVDDIPDIKGNSGVDEGAGEGRRGGGVRRKGNESVKGTKGML